MRICILTNILHFMKLQRMQHLDLNSQDENDLQFVKSIIQLQIVLVQIIIKLRTIIVNQL